MKPPHPEARLVEWSKLTYRCDHEACERSADYSITIAEPDHPFRLRRMLTYCWEHLPQPFRAQIEHDRNPANWAGPHGDGS